MSEACRWGKAESGEGGYYKGNMRQMQLGVKEAEAKVGEGGLEREGEAISCC